MKYKHLNLRLTPHPIAFAQLCIEIMIIIANESDHAADTNALIRCIVETGFHIVS